ncbi:hypothetical protein [Cochlodiniinecator piscidefendens]|uniref:hypothetical protein n=1 Tax=Cochlodiniinecator piscidefendens TaxID=2715756 RepID=UPI00140B9C58|nr:hypothetical protein [Cochlodiniinecator piscidefendens]
MHHDTDAQTKTHYICQMYEKKPSGRGKPDALVVANTFQYTTAAQAEDRAQRVFAAQQYVGADAYSLVEDLTSDEVGEPNFLVRLGEVPDLEN